MLRKPARPNGPRSCRRRASRATGPLLAAVCSIALTALTALPAMASAPAAAGHYVVTITTPGESPFVGAPFVIRGSVTPAADGTVVKLQRFVAGAFETVAKDRLDASSDYKFSQTGSSVGGVIYRVAKPSHGHVHRGFSPQQRIFITGDTLRSGPVLRTGDSLISSGGSYRLMMQANGNLSILLTSTGRLIWSMQTSGHAGAWAQLQRDGNLVVHAADGSVLKTTGTGGHPSGSYGLQIREDSNLVITTPGGNPFWSSHTTNDTLGSTEALRAGQSLQSSDRRFQVVMQDDGNLVLYDTSDGSIDWASNTDVPGSMVTMQARGAMVITGPFGRVLWSSRTVVYPGAEAVLQTDGNFVIYQGGKARWSSRGVGGVLGDDYPAYLRNADRDSLIDPWRFYNRECTSFVAWRMNSANGVAFSNFMDGGRFGSAYNWDDNARALGFTVNTIPARGAIAESDKEGHVAWVAAVGNGTVTIEDYNYSSPGGYGTRVVPTSTYIYIHIKDM